MKHRIKPTVDCIFKCILGSKENKNLLVHFLNAVLEPEKGSQIRDVTIENPYNEKEFVGDKLSIVDVKAMDEKGRMYQIEIQLAVHAALSARILYTWSGIYRSQIQEGDDYKKLKRAVSIWVLNESLFEDTKACHLPFSAYNSEHKLALTDHLAIHLLQLPECKPEKMIKSEKERWIYLFKEGENIDADNPPDSMKTKEMMQVMKVLQRFSENQKDYFLYQSRLDAILKENTYISELEEAMKKKEQAEKAEKQAVKEKEQAVKEKKEVQDRLQDVLQLLKKKGIDPDKELVH
ncbi:MAG: Rpn family recombination-promoting nuclease/putative transposase [Gammaproteobacteria bacterium]|nr:Rpn family recombination-promoting nuclease/putative transposase [Gammaproteobacteria bacterium]